MDEYSFFAEEQISKIQDGLIKAQEVSNLEIIKETEKYMSYIEDSNRYLNIDTLIMGQFNLGQTIKDKVEKLCGFLSLFAGNNSRYEKFVNWYYETHKGALLKVKDVMNEVNLLGYFEILSDLGEVKNKEENDNQTILADYIRENIQNHCITLDDLSFEMKKKYYGKFEINLQLLERDDEICFMVPYSYGSTNNYAFSTKYFFDENMCSDENGEILDVEISFWPKSRKVANVLYLKSPYKYTLAYGAVRDRSNPFELDIDDIYVGIENEHIFFYSVQLKKRLIFHVSSKANSVYYPIFVKFLCGASGTMENSIFSIFSLLDKIIETNQHIPRITYRDYILFPEQWVIKGKNDDFDAFKKRVISSINRKEIILYGDEYLILDLRIDEHFQILYGEYKKNHEIRLCENLYEKFNPMIRDSNGESYIGEFVFQISSVNKESGYENYIDSSSVLNQDIRKRHTYLPFEEWFFYKIYTKKNYENEILIKYIAPLMNRLRDNKYIRKFYFVRYFEDDSYSIRLKILVNAGKEWLFLKEIMSLQNELSVNNLTNRCVIDTYEQEVMRYGGEDVYEKVENFFCLNSEMDIMLIKNHNDTFEETILSIIGMLDLNGLSYESRKEILDLKGIVRKESKDYRIIKRKIWPLLIKNKYLDKDSNLYKSQKIMLEGILESIKNNGNEVMVNEIFPDIIHMHINRLYGINREKETEIINYCYLLLNSLDAYTKRIK